MSKPFIHAKSSAEKFGGKPSDYVKIHEKLDCSKGEIGDLRHRLLTHHMFFVRECIVPHFGSTVTNSDGKEVSVVDVCEQHIVEDFSDEGKHDGFIPTAGDYLAHVDFVTWINNGEDGEVPLSQLPRTEWMKKKQTPKPGLVDDQAQSSTGVFDGSRERVRTPKIHEPRHESLIHQVAHQDDEDDYLSSHHSNVEDDISTHLIAPNQETLRRVHDAISEMSKDDDKPRQHPGGKGFTGMFD